MYWDGLVLSGESPAEGILVAGGSLDTHQDMVSRLNEMTDAAGSRYNLVIKTHADFNLG
jgi:hypothetical protein